MYEKKNCFELRQIRNIEVLISSHFIVLNILFWNREKDLMILNSDFSWFNLLSLSYGMDKGWFVYSSNVKFSVSALFLSSFQIWYASNSRKSSLDI